jgi:hypothetical protein
MKLPIYLELGSKRVFASAADWPGWSRGGKDEASALQSLLDYAPRYATAIRSARLGFAPPGTLADFKVLERLKGDTTTDFGSPGAVPAADAQPVDQDELRRLQDLLRACWRTFDETVNSARGRSLRTGPRGGGRDLEKIFNHVLEAQHAYVTKLGWKWPSVEALDNEELRQQALAALAASAHGELPTRGPRGGLYWPARYFVRRAAWHILDHAWEIEDRIS